MTCYLWVRLHASSSKSATVLVRLSSHRRPACIRCCDRTCRFVRFNFGQTAPSSLLRNVGFFRWWLEATRNSEEGQTRNFRAGIEPATTEPRVDSLLVKLKGHLARAIRCRSLPLLWFLARRDQGQVQECYVLLAGSPGSRFLRTRSVLFM